MRVGASGITVCCAVRQLYAGMLAHRAGVVCVGIILAWRLGACVLQLSAFIVVFERKTHLYTSEVRL